MKHSTLSWIWLLALLVVTTACTKHSAVGGAPGSSRPAGANPATGVPVGAVNATSDRGPFHGPIGVGPFEAVTFVLGTDGRLWAEQRNYLGDKRERFLQDANVLSFKALGDGTVFVLGTDRKLWLEPIGFFRCGELTTVTEACGLSRALQDANVLDFDALVVGAIDPTVPTVLVLGTDNNLWVEPPGWLACLPPEPYTNVNTPCGVGRILQDSTVLSFRPFFRELGPGVQVPFVMVQGLNRRLWQEPVGWFSCGVIDKAPAGVDPEFTVSACGHVRFQQDQNVRNFEVMYSGGAQPRIVVQAMDGNLWGEDLAFLYCNALDTDVPNAVSACGHTMGRFLQDKNVQDFRLLPSAPGERPAVAVLGLDNNLWIEDLGFLTCFALDTDTNARTACGRTSFRLLQDANVFAFDVLDGGVGNLLLVRSAVDQKLWVEPAGFLDCGNLACALPRTLQDDNVAANTVAGGDGLPRRRDDGAIERDPHRRTFQGTTDVYGEYTSAVAF